MRAGRTIILSVLLIGLTIVCWAVPSRLSAAEGPFRLLSSGPAGVRLAFELPAWSVEPLSRDGRDYARLNAAGAQMYGPPGYPPLPRWSVALAVPPGAVVSASLGEGETSQSMRIGTLAPSESSPDNETGEASFQNLSPEYTRGGEYPASALSLAGPFAFRDYRIVQLTVSPFSYNPSTGRLSVRRSLNLSLTFSGSIPEAPASGGPDPLVRGALFNWQSAAAWRTPRSGSHLAASTASPFDRAPRWAMLSVDSSGIYSLSGSELQAAGADLSGMIPSNLRLYWGGGRMLQEAPEAAQPDLREVAIRIIGAQDGSFDPSDRIIFFGQGLDRFFLNDSGAVTSLRHRYDSRAVYWLAWGDPSASGLRMLENTVAPSQSVLPVTTAERWLHFERNTVYFPDLQIEESKLDPAPDYWAWVEDSDSPDNRERQLDLPVIPLSGGNWLRCQFYGQERYATALWRLNLNGDLLSQGANYSATAVTTGWKAIPENGLGESGNILALAGSGQILGFAELRVNTALAVNGRTQTEFHLRKDSGPAVCEVSEDTARETEVYDVTRPEQPVHVSAVERNGSSARFALATVSDSLRSFVVLTDSAYARPATVSLFEPPGLHRLAGAEYLVITPRSLATQAHALADTRASRLSTQVVAVEDIYDEFALGQRDPAAIRNFLKYAFESWSVLPRFAVLFGDGHNDYRGYTAEGRARPNLILPYINILDTAVDEWFARFESGAPPQVSLGRLTVKSAAEAATVVDKIARYEQGRDRGDWVRRAVLVADDGYSSGGNCDQVGGLAAGSESIDSLLPNDLERKKVYLDRYPFDPPEIGSRKPAATRDLIQWWNRGALLINYFGHGSPTQWAQELVLDVERDLPLLSNGYKLPLVLSSSCSIGYFDSYRSDAMAERLLTTSGGGAIAVYAGTRVTYAGLDLALNRLMVQNLFTTQTVTVGEAALQARLGMGDTGSSNSEQYTVFGDPALLLHAPVGQLDTQLESAATLQPGGKVEFNGSVKNTAGQTLNDFSGVAQIKFLSDADKVTLSYQCNLGGATSTQQVSLVPAPSVLFDGSVTVSGGRFSGAFVLPLNLAQTQDSDSLSRAAGSGRFLGYATSESADASGAGDKLPVSRQGLALSDSAGPEMHVLYRDRELRDGDRVSSGTPLVLSLKDLSGINTTGDPGYQLSLEVDEGSSYSADLTGFFRYRTDSYQEGSVEVNLSAIGEGLHSFRFRATDNALNSSRLEIMLSVSQAGTALSLGNVLNYPNPFRDETDICFDLGAAADVRVRIFSVAGRPVRELRVFGAAAGFNRVRWDGRDEYQEKVANGVYIYKIICKPVSGTANDTEEVEATGKALLSR